MVMPGRAFVSLQGCLRVEPSCAFPNIALIFGIVRARDRNVSTKGCRRDKFRIAHHAFCMVFWLVSVVNVLICSGNMDKDPLAPWAALAHELSGRVANCRIVMFQEFGEVWERDIAVLMTRIAVGWSSRS